MPHVGYRVRPAPVGPPAPPLRSVAPLTAQADLPAVPGEVDILDLPMADAPVRTDRPAVPFAAPRRRERSSNPFLPLISMAKHKVTADDVAKYLFQDEQ